MGQRPVGALEVLLGNAPFAGEHAAAGQKCAVFGLEHAGHHDGFVAPVHEDDVPQNPLQGEETGPEHAHDVPVVRGRA